MRIGITGHRYLKTTQQWRWVEDQFKSYLAHLSVNPIGITSLAIGADQRFADAVLTHGGTLEAIIPFEGYELKFETRDDKRNYLRLLALSTKVETLQKGGSDVEAYYAAGKRVVDTSEILIAVWDGEPAAGFGGTGDAVQYALSQGVRVLHLNPTNQSITRY